MKKQRDTFFDIIKGMAIILVVLGHSVQALNHVGWRANGLELAIIAMHMPLFIALSGYFLYPSVSNGSITEYSYKKFLCLLLPSITYDIYKIIKQVIISRLGNQVFSINLYEHFNHYGLWYLTALFLLCIIAKIIESSVPKYRYYAWIVVIAALMLTPDWPMVSQIRFLAPFFVLGSWLKRYDWKQIPWYIVIVAALVYTIGVIWFKFEYSMYSLKHSNDSFYTIYMCRFFVGCAGVLLAVWLCKWLNYSQGITRILSYIGEHTLPIYILQSIFFSNFKYLHYQNSSFIAYIILTIVVVALSLVTYRICTNKYIRFYIFGESQLNLMK